MKKKKFFKIQLALIVILSFMSTFNTLSQENASVEINLAEQCNCDTAFILNDTLLVIGKDTINLSKLDTHLDSVVQKEDTLYFYVEDKLIDTAVISIDIDRIRDTLVLDKKFLDSIFTFTRDSLILDKKFNDSIFATIRDSLILDKKFADSIYTHIRDSLILDKAFKDSIDTHLDSVVKKGDTLYFYVEDKLIDTAVISIDIDRIRDTLVLDKKFLDSIFTFTRDSLILDKKFNDSIFATIRDSLILDKKFADSIYTHIRDSLILDKAFKDSIDTHLDSVVKKGDTLYFYVEDKLIDTAVISIDIGRIRDTLVLDKKFLDSIFTFTRDSLILDKKFNDSIFATIRDSLILDKKFADSIYTHIRDSLILDKAFKDSIDTHLDSVVKKGDTLYFYVEDKLIDTAVISIDIGRIRDTLVLDKKFLDSIFTFTRDSLILDKKFNDSIFATIRDSLILDKKFADSIYTHIRDSLILDKAFKDSIDTHLDSVVKKGDTLYFYVEDKLIDTAVISIDIGRIRDTLVLDKKFLDSIFTLTRDSLILDKKFTDSIYVHIRDSLVLDKAFKDSIDTHLDSVVQKGDTLYFYVEDKLIDTAVIGIDVGRIRDTLLLDKKFLDSIFTFTRDSLILDKKFNDSIFATIRDSLILDKKFADSIYTHIRDSLILDKAFKDSIDTHLDSVVKKGDTLYFYVEDKLIDTAVISIDIGRIRDTLVLDKKFLDSIFTLTRDSLILDKKFNDSIFATIRDSLILDKKFADSIYTHIRDSLILDKAFKDSIDTHLDSVVKKGDTLYFYVEDKLIDTAVIGIDIGRIRDTLVLDKKFLDSIFTFTRDSLILDKKFNDSIFATIRDSLILDKKFTDSIYVHIRDSLVLDKAFKDSIDTHLDSVVQKGDTLYFYVEDKLIDTAVIGIDVGRIRDTLLLDKKFLDSIFTFTRDSLILDKKFNDSIFATIRDSLILDKKFNDSIFATIRDSLILDKKFADSIYTHIRDSLILDKAFKDSIDTHLDSVVKKGDTLYFYVEDKLIDTAVISIDIGRIRDTLVLDKKFLDSIFTFTRDSLILDKKFNDSIFATIRDSLILDKKFTDSIYTHIRDSLILDKTFKDSIDTHLDSVVKKGDTLYFYVEDKLIDTAIIGIDIGRIRDTLVLDKKFLDSIFTFTRDSLILDKKFNDSIYTHIRDSLILDKAFKDSIDTHLDSVVKKGDTLYFYVEDKLIDTAVISIDIGRIRDTLVLDKKFLDSIFTLTRDSLILDKKFNDSIFATIRDSLILDKKFADSIYTHIRDSLILDKAFKDSIDTHLDSVVKKGDTLYFYVEDKLIDTAVIGIDVGRIRDTLLLDKKFLDSIFTFTRDSLILDKKFNDSIFATIRDSLILDKKFADSIYTHIRDSLILDKAFKDSIDTHLDSVIQKGDTLYFYVEDKLIDTAVIGIDVGRIRDTLVLDKKFLDSIFTFTRDSLILDKKFNDSIFATIRDSLILDKKFADSIYTHIRDSLILDKAFKDSIDTHLDSVVKKGDTLYFYVEDKLIDTAVISIDIDRIRDTLVLDKKFLDSIFTFTRDSLILDKKFNDSIFATIRDSLILDKKFADSIYTHIRDSLILDKAFKDSIDTHLDSVVKKGDTLYFYVEDKLIDTAVIGIDIDRIRDTLVLDKKFLDSIFTFTRDSLILDKKFNDSIFATIRDSLILDKKFADSIYTHIRDSLILDKAFKDSIDTHLDSVVKKGDTLYFYVEDKPIDTAVIGIDIGRIRDTLLLDKKFLDSIFTFTRDSLILDKKFNDSIFATIRDSLILDKKFADSIYTHIRDSLILDKAFKDSIDTHLDSVVKKGDTLYFYVEDKLIDTAVISIDIDRIRDTLVLDKKFLDSIFTLTRDSLILDKKFNDSIFATIRDSLILDKKFADSIYTHIRDSLILDKAFKDSIDTHLDSVVKKGDTLYFYVEDKLIDTAVISIDIDRIRDTLVLDKKFLDSIFTFTRDSLILDKKFNDSIFATIRDSLILDKKFADSIYTHIRDSLILDKAFKDSIDTHLDSVVKKGDTLYFYVEDKLIDTAVISIDIGRIRDTLVLDKKFLDSIFTLTRDSLILDKKFTDSIYVHIRDSLVLDKAFKDSIDTHLDSVVQKGDTLYFYVEDKLIDTAVIGIDVGRIRDTLLLDKKFLDSIFTFTRDSLILDKKFNDSIFATIRDSLILDKKFADSIYTHIRDSLILDKAFKDSIDTHLDSVVKKGDTLYFYVEDKLIDTAVISIDIGRIRDTLVLDKKFLDSIFTLTRDSLILDKKFTDSIYVHIRDSLILDKAFKDSIDTHLDSVVQKGDTLYFYVEDKLIDTAVIGIDIDRIRDTLVLDKKFLDSIFTFTRDSLILDKKFNDSIFATIRDSLILDKKFTDSIYTHIRDSLILDKTFKDSIDTHLDSVVKKEDTLYFYVEDKLIDRAVIGIDIGRIRDTLVLDKKFLDSIFTFTRDSLILDKKFADSIYTHIRDSLILDKAFKDSVDTHLDSVVQKGDTLYFYVEDKLIDRAVIGIDVGRIRDTLVLDKKFLDSIFTFTRDSLILDKKFNDSIYVHIRDSLVLDKAFKDSIDTHLDSVVKKGDTLYFYVADRIVDTAVLSVDLDRIRDTLLLDKRFLDSIFTLTRDSLILDKKFTDSIYVHIRDSLILDKAFKDSIDTHLDSVVQKGDKLFFYVGNAIVDTVKMTPTAADDDHDFYKVGTTSAPDSITDDIFTQGNLGIGTNSPRERLDVEGKIRVGQMDEMTASDYIVVWGDDYTLRYINPSNLEIGDDHDFYEVGTTTAPDNIDDDVWTNGNLGIGTNSPRERLDVAGKIRVGQMDEMTTSDYIVVWGDDYTLRYINPSNLEVGDDHDFYKVGTTSAPDSITDDIFTQGNLGIGTNSPRERLDVEGKIRVGQMDEMTASDYIVVWGDDYTLRYINPSNLEIGDDHDFYEVGTTTAPDNIDDDVWTNGNLGIGTNSPRERLDVAGKVRVGQMDEMTTSDYIVVWGDDYTLRYINPSNLEVGDDHDFYKVGTTSAPDSITDDIFTQGNLGIGTNSPRERLDVEGKIRVGQMDEMTASDYIVVWGDDYTLRYINPSNLEIGDDHDFYEVGTTTAPDNIDDDVWTNGNLGIGTNSPRERLDVAGKIRVGQMDEMTASDYIVVWGDDYTLRYINPSNLEIGDDHDFYEVGTTTAPDNIDDDVWTNGNLGIGTNSPRERLDVAGKVRVGQMDEMTTSDYIVVWGDDYTLRYINPSNLEVGDDHDFYKVGTTSAPDSITDDIFTQGNLGIGTNSPRERLDVAGKVRVGQMDEMTTSDYIVVWGDDYTLRYINPSNLEVGDDHDFYKVGTTSAPDSITDDIFTQGNLGIGTNSPRERLDVAGKVRVGQMDEMTTSDYIVVWGDDYTLRYINPSNLEVGDDHDFYKVGTTSAPDSITDDIFTQGNLGIGTNSPRERLDVAGKVRVGQMDEMTTSDYIVVWGDDYTLRYINPSNLEIGDDHDFYEVGTTTAPDNINDNVWTNGRVGIGTNTPDESLHVAGKVKIETIDQGTGSEALLVHGDDNVVKKIDKLQPKKIDKSNAKDGDVLVWNETNNSWEPGTLKEVSFQYFQVIATGNIIVNWKSIIRGDAYIFPTSKVIHNSIPGLTYTKTSRNAIKMPPGEYLINFTMNAAHSPPNVKRNLELVSYFFDFTASGLRLRVHQNQVFSYQGNHGVSLTRFVVNKKEETIRFGVGKGNSDLFNGRLKIHTKNGVTALTIVKYR